MEAKLNKDDLEALQEAFFLEGDGYNNRLSVNREQFCDAVSLILNKGTTEEWRELFDKIDVTKEGVVDWDKLATHMMVELMEKDDRSKSNQVPHWKPLRNLPSPHKDVIERVQYLKTSNKYIAISKEGKVSMWDIGLNLSRSLKAGTESCRSKDVWVTSYAPLYNLNKIALAFTSKEIAVYDLSSKMDFHCQFRIQGLLDTPISLEYWSELSNHENINEALLVWGDTDGGVTAIHFTSANIALFERPAQATGDNPDIGFVVFLKEIGKKYKNARLLNHHGHTDWVRQGKIMG